MTVPLVAEFSACTSAYGRLAPLPPVAAAQAGWAARATTPPTASSEALPARAMARLRSPMGWNTFAPLGPEPEPAPAAPQPGGTEKPGLAAVARSGTPRRLRDRDR